MDSDIDFDMEIIIVDNNSSDNSVEYIPPRFPNVNIISNKDNPGFSKANNQGIKIAKGEYILILNPDTVLGEHVLKDACDFMDKNPDAGAVGVKMINGYGQFLPESKRGLPTPWASFCKIFGLAKLFPKSRFFGKYHLKYLDENEPHEVEILAGAFMMVRKSALDKAGMFDESFFMYGEDIDLSYRILKSEYKNYYLPLRIIHYKGESTKKGDIRYIKAFYQAMYIFFKKHYPGYGGLYSFFVKSGIYARASISAMTSIFVKENKEKKITHPSLFKVLSHSTMSYEEIIREMDNDKTKKNEYRIYSPKSGMVIGSHYAEKYPVDVTE